jgi:hypothetical protein
MIEKIQKLLNLSASCNEAEAQAAFQKAKALADKYNLDLELIAIQENREAEKLPFEQCNIMTGRLPVIHKYITDIIQTYFHVKIIYSNKGNRQTQLVFVGRKDKTQIAKEVYNQLITVFDYLWKQYKTKYSYTNREKASYLFGLSQGFSSKMAEQEQTSKREAVLKLPDSIQSECEKKLEIVLVNEKAELNNAVADFYPKLGVKRMTITRITRRDVYQDGYNDGQNIRVGDNQNCLMGV